MTDPTKALADAARSLLDGVKDTFLKDAARVRVLEHALAAYDAAQQLTGLDWPEDFALENGNYTSVCVTCGLAFTGHKRRFVCKACYDAAQDRRRLVEAIADSNAAQATEQIPPTDEDADRFVRACANIDWGQFTLNGGGCFHVEEGRLCGRAFHWAGHESGEHLFVPLHVAVSSLMRARPNRQAPLDSSTHADTREGWEWKGEVFRLRKVLQAAKAVVDSSVSWDDVAGYNVGTDALENLNAEVERASKGGAA